MLWKLVQWEASFSMGTDRHEANSHCSQFCKHFYNFLSPPTHRQQWNPCNPVTLLTDRSIPGSLALTFLSQISIITS